MRRRMSCAPLIAAVLLATLSGCSTPSYRNAKNPGYGEAEYKRDQEQCRSSNSRLVASSGYDEKLELKPDEAKVTTCMTQLGWQAAGQ